MKAIASSIVVAAGMYGIVASFPMLSSTASLFPFIALVAGLITLAVGLVGWWACLKYER